MDDQRKGWKFWERQRHIVAFLAFLGFFNVYALRVNLSVGIVAMTSSVVSENGTVLQEAEFDWSPSTRGLVLSCFFYGYLCTQLLGGWLGAKYGGARVYGMGVGSTAVLTMLTPFVARWSVYLLVALRILEGLFEGVTYPCIHAVWAKWAPPSERGTMASLAFSGSHFGTVITLPLAGYLANHFGWPSIFYFTSSIGILWLIVWTYYVYDQPDDDPRITESELKFIKESLGDNNMKDIVHPWGEFVKSLPVWAIVAAHFCENWGFYTLLTQLPSFMKDTLNFDLQKAGYLSALPYLVMSIIMQFAGRLSDWICNKKFTSVTNVRKIFNCGAFIAQTVFMMLAAYLLTPTSVIVCLVLAVGLGAFAWPAFSVNHLDIAPQHASVLMGFSNTFGTVPGIISPLLSGYIVTNQTADEWKMVFFISSAIYMVGAIFYGIFASGERQAWAMESYASKKEKDVEQHAYTNPTAPTDHS
ncbi:MFS transporter, ACS family, solute carrier family 17 (sodium-dependent inorganic phosphate cotransporter), other [Nesidiocoris tenuis]|uniref:MFS transporter, ACS family, solute carrier family 17 (Sodium-dependent inorganic phosphate cotransporter), other n=1 Tax=Nesidiocoris tenuis TaxID=355587 RepID=A0ABN7AQ96_9HEMI|nr:MFS transporter, ACS family, solute carrier family 17 (sodium-dependent inorganic phosphate cotransporter), other [Nesidiocoris tenuis]